MRQTACQQSADDACETNAGTRGATISQLLSRDARVLAETALAELMTRRRRDGGATAASTPRVPGAVIQTPGALRHPASSREVTSRRSPFDPLLGYPFIQQRPRHDSGGVQPWETRGKQANDNIVIA